MIFCFEGPSAIGKTTLSISLEPEFLRVAEVNELFGKNPQTSKYWYFDRQIDRYKICLQSTKHSILDGDIFQPLWYNWSYNFPQGYLDLNKLKDYYSNKIKHNDFAFPDHYIIFQSTESELRKRKLKDTKRKRRNFEKHLILIHTQEQYFKFLESVFPEMVTFLDYSNFEEALINVQAILHKPSQMQRVDNMKLLSTILEWLSQNDPNR